jgi:hypothetical protein
MIRSYRLFFPVEDPTLASEPGQVVVWASKACPERCIDGQEAIRVDLWNAILEAKMCFRPRKASSLKWVFRRLSSA